MEKENNQSLEQCLLENTKFMFHPEMGLKKHSVSKNISVDTFQMIKMRDETGLDLYDAFLLYALYSIGHATKMQVIEWMDIYQRHYPKKSLPNWNSQKITKRLNSLASKGLVYCCDYITTTKNVILIYTCTRFGYIYFKNTLDISYLPFDDNVMFHAEVETFKRMSAASVTLGLARNKECIAVSIGGRLLFGRDLKQKNSLFTYGWVILEHEGKKQMYIVEPIYFNVDERVLSKEEAVQRTSRRMRDFEMFCTNCRREMGIPVIPVYCVENMKGLQRFCMIAKERRGTDIYQSALYTSENVIFKFAGDMDQVFVSAVFERKGEDVKVQMIPTGPKWIEKH